MRLLHQQQHHLRGITRHTRYLFMQTTTLKAMTLSQDVQMLDSDER
jgi:hypothetical protein